MWIDRGRYDRGTPALNAGVDLIFCRTFDGWSGTERDYVEVNQEYTHLTGIHWRPERKAYCRFDGNGDLSDIVSITLDRESHGVGLVTFTRPEIDDYLNIAGYALVRMFDFTLSRHLQFGGWTDDPEMTIRKSSEFLYRQKISGTSAYTRGIQIIRPAITHCTNNGPFERLYGKTTREYATFIAHDWRNEKISPISTDPSATTNYFVAHSNDLPFELSPAFFRPEILSRYKTDREKYKLGDREIQCRASWVLRGYDVNDAGQVFAYICYLRNLPYSEQLHWKSFNEAPKAPISKRALVNDFEGKFVSFPHPRTATLSILRRWQSSRSRWWTLRDEDLLDRANTPISSSKDEWAEAIMDLSKLVVEGFELKFLRTILEDRQVAYTSQEKSIVLLEKIVAANNPTDCPGALKGLRMVQHIRSKAKGHAGGSEGKAIAQEAIATHGTYGDHFKYLCEMIVEDLERIETAMSK